MAIQGGWILYGNTPDFTAGREGSAKGLYKINVDGSGQGKLCDDSPRGINVIGDMVYFCNDADRVLYSIRTDETGLKKLLDDTWMRFFKSRAVQSQLLFRSKNSLYLTGLRTPAPSGQPFS